MRLIISNYSNKIPLATKLLLIRGMDYLGVIVTTCQSLALLTVVSVSQKFKKVEAEIREKLRNF